MAKIWSNTDEREASLAENLLEQDTAMQTPGPLGSSQGSV